MRGLQTPRRYQVTSIPLGLGKVVLGKIKGLDLLPSAKLTSSIGNITLEQSTGPATYYVSDSENDASDGLWPASPWQTISRANQGKLNPGDRLLFEGGKTFTGGLTLRNLVGTAANPVVVGSYGSGRAILRAPDGNTPGIFVYNSAYLEIRNLVLSGVGTAAADGLIAYADSPGLQHLYVSELEVSGFAVGINVQSSVNSFRDVRVTWCTLHDNANTGVFLGGINRGDLADVYVSHCEAFNHAGERGYGFYLFHVAAATVERSVAHDNGGSSSHPQAFAEADGVTIRHCEAYRTTTAARDAAGFLIDGGSTNCVIEYCYAHDNWGAGFQMTSYAGAGVQFRGNVIRYCVSVNNGLGVGGYGESATWPLADSAAYGNTIFADVSRLAKPLGQIYLLSYLKNWGVYNNLVVVKGDLPVVEAWLGSPANTVNAAGNAFWTVGGTPRFQEGGRNHASVAAWRGVTGWESFHGKPTGKVGDPLFQSGAYSSEVVGIGEIDSLEEKLGGWRLQGGSPVIDAGVDLRSLGISPGPPGTDFFGGQTPQGGLYDVGANEVR
ncbi:hypothetical protein KFL_003840110 [Klebsormidium nitens]|uniref:Right handed beta helix domain-containing protein n=1 Tax=Klebsormidium nitens TaxID=105231 RepID=A0A1Y1IIA4_KLENI|nr:hypothetical protein KFL_003840110 [Klebsormidium nitens]|eukprot:GAQ87878.1 hypothetical protein KFL_003840110 [Klebsormidium nitens]